MEAIKSRLFSIPVSVVSAFIINCIIFMGLPVLTQIQRSYEERQLRESIMLARYQPPAPPEVLKDRQIKDKKPQSTKKASKAKRTTTATPKISMPKFSFGGAVADLSASVQISAPKQPTLTTSLFQTAFTLAEVDQPPRPLRTVEPLFPFAAKRKNIEGRVLIRCVVTKEGDVLEPSVLESEPPGVFDSSALKAVVRWKFRPAVKDGRAVDVIVNIPLKFNLIK